MAQSGQQGIAVYASSARGQRHFCRICGSVVPGLVAESGMAILPAGNLEGNLDVRPQLHRFVGSKASWMEITDRVPQDLEALPSS